MNNHIKIFFLLFGSIYYSDALYSQCYIKNPLTSSQRNFEASRSTYMRLKSDWQCEVKVIRVNFHFIRKSNGSRNFGPDDDGYNGINTGYDYAHKIIESLNADLLTNTKMQLPPNNNTSVNIKNYKFIVNGVYYHQNDNYWSNPDGVNSSGTSFISLMRASSPGLNQNNEFDIFINTNSNANLTTPVNSIPRPFPAIGGHANNTSSIGGDKYLVTNEYAGYEHLIGNNFLNEWNGPIGVRLTRDKVFEMIAGGFGLIHHELNHLLSLDHTVMYPWGSPCPTIKDNGTGSVDVNCDDFCWDTPSAWFMRDNLNAPRHPANVLGTPKTEWETWGSNNRMEYSGYNALTPNQLSRIHSALENSNLLRGYLLCERVKTDLNLCSFNANMTLYNGKKVTLNKNCGPSTLTVPTKRYVKVVYNDNESTEIFNNFEVKDGGYFEILSSCVCN